MLSSDQTKNITYLYNKFLDSELNGWTNLDNFLELLEYLDDDQLYRECEVLYSHHKRKTMGCPYEHTKDSVCFVKGILEAVEAITDLYQETGNLHPNNRYVLAYYLALCEDGQIVELLDP
jgi:hypothetical protein